MLELETVVFPIECVCAAGARLFVGDGRGPPAASVRLAASVVALVPAARPARAIAFDSRVSRKRPFCPAFESRHSASMISSQDFRDFTDQLRVGGGGLVRTPGRQK